MSPNIYKILHVTGALLIFLSLGGAVVRASLANADAPIKKLIGITNGVGLLLSLVAGFGLLAKLGLGFPGWVMAKMVIWLMLGGLLAVMNRRSDLGQMFWFGAIALGVLAAYFAIAKPF